MTNSSQSNKPDNATKDSAFIKHDGVFVLDTKHIGFTGTLATFLIPSKSNDGKFMLVESGPGSTIETIEKAIVAAGFKLSNLEAILLTHIHLDHAGATGSFLQKHNQNAHVYVHQRGAKHMIDPSRLMESARRIYQDKMDTLWGKMEPIDASNLTALDGDINDNNFEVLGHSIKAIYTPGHASHHISFLFDDGTMFTGDSAGAKVYGTTVVRPTLPPPEINIEVYDQSLDTMRQAKPDRLMLTHFGQVLNPQDHFDKVSQANHQWAKLVLDDLNAGLDDNAIVNHLHEVSVAELEADGANQDDIVRHGLISGDAMSVAGLKRYWEKHHPEALTTN